jgi:hypothetical protein
MRQQLSDEDIHLWRQGLALPAPYRNTNRPAWVEDRLTMPRAHERWSEREENLLRGFMAENIESVIAATVLQRTVDEVERRARRLHRQDVARAKGAW